jgi:hypothetical protein
MRPKKRGQADAFATSVEGRTRPVSAHRAVGGASARIVANAIVRHNGLDETHRPARGGGAGLVERNRTEPEPLTTVTVKAVGCLGGDVRPDR